MTIATDYVDLGKIQYLAAARELKEENVDYGENVSITYEVPETEIDAFEK